MFTYSYRDLTEPGLGNTGVDIFLLHNSQAEFGLYSE
jgi:hypothetical protein